LLRIILIDINDTNKEIIGASDLMAEIKKSNLKEPKPAPQIQEKKGFTEALKKLTKKSWYEQHLPWPEKIIRKPTIKLALPKMPKVPVPSRMVLYGAFLIAFAVLIAGFLYDITRNTIPLNYKQEDQTKMVIPQFFWQDMNEQFLIEGIVASIVIMIGAFGVIFLYQATKNFYRPKNAYSYMALGMALMILSFVIISYFIGQKGVKLYSSDF
jgi:hypothetical protein